MGLVEGVEVGVGRPAEAGTPLAGRVVLGSACTHHGVELAEMAAWRGTLNMYIILVHLRYTNQGKRLWL